MLGQTRLIFRVLSKFTLLSRKAYFHKPIYQNSPHAWVYILLNCFHKISWRPFLTLLESNAALLTRQKDSRTLERIYRSCLDQTEDFLHISDLYIHLIKCSSVHTPTNNFWKSNALYLPNWEIALICSNMITGKNTSMRSTLIWATIQLRNHIEFRNF